MVGDQPADVGLDALGRVQATEDRPRHRDALRVVAGEADAAVGHHRPRLRASRRRAGARRSAVRSPRVISSPSGAPSSSADRLGVLGPERARRVALERHCAVEHLEGVVERVEVVVAALLGVAQRLELGQHARAQPELEREPDPLPRALAREHPAKLGVDALARDARERARGCAHALARVGVRGQAEFAGQPDEAQRPQRVVLERAGADEAQPARPQVAGASERVDQLAAAQRPRDRVDREVAPAKVGFDVAAVQRGDVGLPARDRGRRRATRRTRPRAGRRRRARRGRARGPAARSGLGDEVEIGGRRAPEQLVADGAADEPAGALAKRVAREREHARGPS